MKIPVKKNIKLTSFQIIILGFLGLIIFGTLMLMLPFSSAAGETTTLGGALFTAVSSVCVTGLVVYDTASHWSFFGQFIIIFLIQIGGLGVMTIFISLALISGRKISLFQRSTMQDAVSALKVGGIVRFTIFIIRMVLIIEFTGAVVMAPVFCRDFGLRGIWLAVFHSISAFCNAGFDLMGTPEASFASLTAYPQDPVINIVVMLLIIIGGIGFLTWDDILTNRCNFKKYRLQSKVILSTTLALLIVPALYYYFFEFGFLSPTKRIFPALFQSVTTRTAGYNTYDLNLLSEAGMFITIALMLVGGSTGSTAGGMKTNTIAVLFATAICSFRRHVDTHIFGRRIEDEVVKTAATIMLMYIFLCGTGAVIISRAEGLPMLTCIFETASAIGTVGLTLGVTPSLGTLSRIVLIILMFFGRVGGLTLIFAALSRTPKHAPRFPQEKMVVG